MFYTSLNQEKLNKEHHTNAIDVFIISYFALPSIRFKGNYSAATMLYTR